MSHRYKQKLTKSHTSMTPDATQAVKTISQWPEVSKISLGRIVWGLKNGKKGLEAQIQPSQALKLKVFSARSVQTLFIYTANPEKTKQQIESL